MIKIMLEISHFAERKKNFPKIGLFLIFVDLRIFKALKRVKLIIAIKYSDKFGKNRNSWIANSLKIPKFKAKKITKPIN
ncbi:hypothetical protein BpHYR1_015302 [Brachionus plicatilis]|uniref:Uncharacterized protein n=1 Tax=Brachionus plicatilis TaxID=10195 RepID=A0A3M7RYU7_BRAPC|nr:hypothetical protein BpHYR1_015302 [Brachionus plicatilis]